MSKKQKVETLAKKIVDWLNTEDGKKAFEKTMEQTNKTVAELRKARQVDLDILNTPFGPADGSGLWPHQRI